jgi:hypothetical protein
MHSIVSLYVQDLATRQVFAHTYTLCPVRQIPTKKSKTDLPPTHLMILQHHRFNLQIFLCLEKTWRLLLVPDPFKNGALACRWLPRQYRLSHKRRQQTQQAFPRTSYYKPARWSQLLQRRWRRRAGRRKRRRSWRRRWAPTAASGSRINTSNISFCSRSSCRHRVRHSLRRRRRSRIRSRSSRLRHHTLLSSLASPIPHPSLGGEVGPRPAGCRPAG